MQNHLTVPVFWELVNGYPLCMRLSQAVSYMATEQELQTNKDVVRRTVEAVWKKDYSTLDELCAPEFINHDVMVDGDIIGAEGMKQYFDEMHNSFSDTEYTVNDMIAEDDRVVLRGTAHGTHTGEFNGIPATNKSFEVNDMIEFRLKDGKLVESWTIPDGLSMMQQLGVIPKQGS